MSRQRPDQDGARVDLPLVRGAPDQRMSLILFLQTIVFGLSHLFFVLPLKLFFDYFVFRPINPLVKDIGRPLLAHAIVRQIATCYDRWTPAQIRLLLDRKNSYALKHSGSEFKGWVHRVEVNGTAGRWLAPPGSQRKDDDVVIYFVHGGGFIFDSGTNAQHFSLDLIKSLKKDHGIAASVFFLDYRLAPEYKYPSQLIETLAGYHYLVNSLGIPESKIILAGDSAGANLASAFLLHLARPNPVIKVPESLGSTPKRPAGALLISPYTNLFGSTKAFHDNASYDIITPNLIARAAFAYIGAKFPAKFQPRRHGWNPLYLLFPSQKVPPQPAHKLPDVYGWSDVEHIKLFQDPYVNPFVCNDASWWKEACPGEGKTLVAWGGKEIFVDDDQALYNQLEKAGVEPVKVFHPLKLHDWLLHDYGLPMSHRVRRLGNELDDFYFGLKQTVKFVAHVIDEASTPSQPRLDAASTSATDGDKGQTSDGLRTRGNAAIEADYSDEAVSSTVEGLRKAENREASVGAPADYSNEAVIAASVGLRRAEQQAEAQAPAAQSLDGDGGESGSGKASAPPARETTVKVSAAPAGEKVVSRASKDDSSNKAPVPTTDDTDGSYAAVAAHEDHIAQDAPIVAEGEGDVIKRPTEQPAAAPKKQAEKAKKAHAERPVSSEAEAAPPAHKKQSNSGKASAPLTTNDDGSYAAVAAHHEHIARDAPIVVEGEGDVLTPTPEQPATSKKDAEKTNKAHNERSDPPQEDKAAPAAPTKDDRGNASVPATENGVGSYAAIAAHHDHIARDAPIVAAGEGDVIKPSTDASAGPPKEAELEVPTSNGNEGAEEEPAAQSNAASSKSKKKKKAKSANKAKVPAPVDTAKLAQQQAETKGAGSYAAIASHHDHIGGNAPIVAEGEGDVIYPKEA